ncbi:MAG TPA: YtxH domain-containing protein [Gemmatimonadales bacterium]|jgi:gas vesicle protein|nr:YtxH domain-containing protein [Gemmatimonadales bacterium]
MTENHNDVEFQATAPQEDSGGFVALAVLAAALGAGAAVLLAPDEGSQTRRRVKQGLRSLRGDAAQRVAQLQREIRKRRNQARREKRIAAVAGLLVGAGIATLLAPGGAETRTRLGGTLSRIKVGAIDRIERLRAEPAEDETATDQDREVRSVQELGRDPNTVF